MAKCDKCEDYTEDRLTVCSICGGEVCKECLADNIDSMLPDRCIVCAADMEDD
jgi:hypothetical protein